MSSVFTTKPSSSSFMVYPLQQTQPCCTNPRIRMSNDGNQEQHCDKCGWDWNAKYCQVVVENKESMYDSNNRNYRC